MGGKISKDDGDVKHSNEAKKSDLVKPPLKIVARDWPTAQMRENRKFQKDLDNKQPVSKSSRHRPESADKQNVRTQEEVADALSPLSKKELQVQFQSSEKLRMPDQSPVQDNLVINQKHIMKNSNVLPKLTYRVLQQKKVVLCRHPIFNHRSAQDYSTLTPNIRSIIPNDQRLAETPSTNTQGINMQNNSFNNDNPLTNHNILSDIESNSMCRKIQDLSPDYETFGGLQIAGEKHDLDQHSKTQPTQVRSITVVNVANSKDKYQKRSSFNKFAMPTKAQASIKPFQKLPKQERKNSDFTSQHDITQTYDNIIKKQMNLNREQTISTQNSVMFNSNTSTTKDLKAKSAKKITVNSSYKKASAGIMTESSFNKAVQSDKRYSKLTNKYMTKISNLYGNGFTQFSPSVRSNSAIRGDHNGLMHPAIFKQGSMYQEVQDALYGPSSQRVVTKMASEGVPGQNNKVVYSRESSRGRNEASTKTQPLQKKPKIAKEVNFSVQRKPHGIADRIYTRTRKETNQNFVKSISSNQFQQYQVKDDEQISQQPVDDEQAKVEYFSNNEDNFNIRDYQDFSFPKNVVLQILLYCIDDYPQLLRLSAGWYCCINDALDEYSNIIENSFVQKNSKYLNFQKSYINSSPIFFCKQRGIRLDRLFQCEVLPNSSVVNQTFKLSYNFNYHQSTSVSKVPQTSILRLQESTRYGVEYRFDVLKQGTKRVTWIHMSDEIEPYAQNEMQVQSGDIIEFTVCLFNMNGLIDLKSLEWEYPEIIPINQNERDALTYNRDVKLMQRKNDRKTKVHCDINRICEVEDAVPEWIKFGSLRRDQPRIPISTSHYEKRFKVLGIFFNELDWHFNKIVLQSIKKGIVEDKTFGEKVQVIVKGEDEPILNEIKKRGVIFDRNKDKERIQIRLGDTLVVYNTVKITEEMVPDVNIPLSEFQRQYNLSPENTDKKFSHSEKKSSTAEKTGK